MKARVAAVCLLLVATLSACSTPASTVQPDPSFSPNPHRVQLVARAHLDPCPVSVSAPASGGLPDVTLPCLGNGPAVHLAGLRGKPTVVNIWGSWCGPCQKETPYLSRVYDAMHDRVRFLGVDDEDDPSSALDFATHVTPPMRYPSVVDDNKAVLLGLQDSGPIAVPSTVFVAADGHVVHRVIEAYSSDAQLENDIARYLGVHR